MKPIREKIWVTEYEPELGDYLIVLRWDEVEENSEKHNWVDIELHKAFTDGDDGIEFEINDGTTTTGTTTDVEQATPTLEGFCKWGGCTQFNQVDIHVDDQLDLVKLCAAMQEARRQALISMGTIDEYF